MTDIEQIKKCLPTKDWEKSFLRLDSGEPLQYIIGNVDFYNSNFIVSPEVLIPRFETELLVDKTIKYIKQYKFENLKIADLGTGSGCIGISMAKEFNARVDLYDISQEALLVAKENSIRNKVNINIINKDILEELDKKYNIIVSNPPYIDEDEEVEIIVKNNEPNLALYASNKGLLFYEKILSYARNCLEDKFIIAFEIGCTQGEYIKSYSSALFPSAKVTVEQDFTGRDRFIFIINE